MKLGVGNAVIDNCFPLSRRYNNDLWNLLPTTARVNGKKGGKLPSAQAMLDSSPRILEWWEPAYTGKSLKERFNGEAQAA